MRRLRLLVEYDGTSFAGFQLQGAGKRTVQGALERAIEKASGQFARVHGAGRTDAGVHATGQVVHFDSPWSVPPERIGLALGTHLPPEIAVKAAEVVAPDFHARFNASGRVYRYVILNRPVPSALLGRFAYHLRDPLDVPAMQEAGRHLVGHYDFAAFGQPGKPRYSTIRHVWAVQVRPWKSCVLITVRGNAFLRQMVRSFVGTLIMVGRRRMEPGRVEVIRQSANRALCPTIAPARGLCLVRVEYGGQRYEADAENDDEAGDE